MDKAKEKSMSSPAVCCCAELLFFSRTTAWVNHDLCHCSLDLGEGGGMCGCLAPPKIIRFFF